VTLEGGGFEAGIRVFVDSVAIPSGSITSVSDTTVEFLMPAHDPGTVSVSVENPGEETVPSPFDFTFDPFEVTGGAPLEVSLCGGEEIVFQGSSFMAGVTVSFGAFEALSVTVSGETELRAAAPEVPEGTGSVATTLSYQGITIQGPRITFTEPVFIRGDVNGDGVVLMSDTVVLNASLTIDAADVNDDGVVDVSDREYLLEFLFSGGDQPPPPFDEPGVDPTPDDLKNCGDS
jgi:hypothetical protein